MANELPNQYSLGTLPGIEPQTRRVFQDLVDQLNFLTGEVTRLKERDLVVMPRGAARRESPVEGIISIPCRDFGGQDGFARVSKDGVVVSYVNPTESLFPYVDVTTVNSSGAGPDVLHTFQLPANSLALDGDYLKVWYAGGFAVVNRDKAIEAQFDNQNYEGTAALNIDNSTGWLLYNRIMRTSPTSVRISSLLLENILFIDAADAPASFGIGSLAVSRNTGLTVANLNTNAITMRARSVVTGGAANDAFQNLSIIEVYRPRIVKTS